MPNRGTASQTALTSLLNDLLQLDHDAVQAYGLAIRQLESTTRKKALRRYLADHKRHITELKGLIRALGSAPIPVSHIPTGPFKLAMQAMGTLGGDREVLLAFKANERQVRDKYRRAAARKGLPVDVRRVLRRAASDELRHYQWAERSLKQLGVGGRSRTGRAARGVETAHARMADVIEGAQKPLLAAVEATRRGLRAAIEHPVRTASVVAAAAGATSAAVALKRRSR